jgi:hypothetical protein
MKSLKIHVHYEIAGSHVHMAIFAGLGEATTLGKAGDLVLRVEEFESFKKGYANWEFKEIPRR